MIGIENLTIPISETKIMTEQEIIKSVINNYNSFLVNTLIILAVIYIILEILSYTKYNENIYLEQLRTLFYNFFGVFAVYESYYFLTANLSKQYITISNYILIVFIVFICVLLIRKVYIHYKKPK
jgi:preprotein translocase subunit SecG